MKFKSCLDTNGTSLVGYVSTTFADLVKVFGKPQIGPNVDDDKVTCEWNLKSGDVVFTIYDWKVNKTPKGVYEWHVGGYNEDSLKVVEKALGI